MRDQATTMRFVRRVIAVVIAAASVVLLVGLCGCSGSESTQQQATSGSQATQSSAQAGSDVAQGSDAVGDAATSGDAVSGDDGAATDGSPDVDAANQSDDAAEGVPAETSSTNDVPQSVPYEPAQDVAALPVGSVVHVAQVDDTGQAQQSAGASAPENNAAGTGEATNPQSDASGDTAGAADAAGSTSATSGTPDAAAATTAAGATTAATTGASTSTTATASNDDDIIQTPSGARYVAGEVLITVDNTLQTGDICALVNAAGVHVTELELVSTTLQEGCVLVRVAYQGDVDPAQLSQQLQQDQQVVAAEPNSVFTIMQDDDADGTSLQSAPNDTYYKNGKQWGLDAIGAPAAWDIQTTDGAVTVAILDTGVDYDHPDLAANLVDQQYWKNTYTNETGAAAVDDDHASGHGTHVAGIVAAVADNELGVAGVSYNAKVLPVKVTHGSDGKSISNSDIIEAIDYVTLCKTQAATTETANIRVLSMSLGGYYDGDGEGEDDFTPTQFETLELSIQNAQDAGILVVAAAGNDSKDLPCYPASYDGVISVSALKKNAAASTGVEFDSNYSNYGPYVDLAAPGTTTYSTVLNESYGSKRGTSMATPHVAAAAAVVFAAYPDATPQQVKELLEATATDIVDETCAEGRDDYTGHGLLRLDQALSVIPMWSVQIAQVDQQTYCGASVEPSLTLTFKGQTLQQDVDYELEYSDNTDAGTATITVTGLGKVLGQTQVEFDIVPCSVVVTADDATKTQGQDDPTFTATVTGTIDGQEDLVSYTLSRQEGEEPGTYAIEATGEALQGNYAVTFVPGTLTIEAAPGGSGTGDDPGDSGSGSGTNTNSGGTSGNGSGSGSGSGTNTNSGGTNGSNSGSGTNSNSGGTSGNGSGSGSGSGTNTNSGGTSGNGSGSGTNSGGNGSNSGSGSNSGGTSADDPEQTDVQLTVTRLAGDDRFGTMSAVLDASGFADGSCKTILLASGMDFPDALTGSSLAGLWNAPLLITAPNELSSQAAAQIQRLAAKDATVCILGGSSAVSQAVQRQVAALDNVATVRRIAGEDRYGTALAIFEEGVGQWSSTAIVADATSFADALAAGVYAAAAKAPVFLAQHGGGLTDSQVSVARAAGVTQVIVMGGNSAVNFSSVQKQLGQGVAYARFAGQTRLQTSQMFASWASGQSSGSGSQASFAPSVVLNADGMAVANAWNYPDALVSVNLLRGSGSVLLLVDQSQACKSALEEFVASNAQRIATIYALGGPAAVPQQVLDWLQ